MDGNDSEKIEVEKYQLEEENLQKLYYILNHDFLRYDEGELPLEFNGWNIKYYDPEGNLIHEFLRGGADLKCIDRIVNIIHGH